MSSLVKPEYGPTLPELLRPRWRAASRGARIAAVAAAALVVAALAAWMLLGGEDRERIVVQGPPAFNLAYAPGSLERVAPRGRELLALRTPAGTPAPQRLTVSPITLPAYEGDPSGTLPIVASNLIAEMQRADPTFRVRSEGRARVNRQPGYQIQYQFERDGRTWYGRRALLFEDEPGVREGADVDVQAARSVSVPSVDAAGSNGPTKTPYRSFRLGAEAP